MILQVDVKELEHSKLPREQMVTVSDNEQIKIIHYEPKESFLNEEQKMPVILVSGWLALAESYFAIIDRLVFAGHKVLFIETREKNSSSTTEQSDLSGERLFRDVQEVLQKLSFSEPFLMFGHSLGAICALLQAMDEENPHNVPAVIVALQPVMKSVIQKEQLAIFKLPTPLFRIARKLMVKIAPLFSSKLKESVYSRKRFEQEFLGSDPGKLRRSAIGFSDFDMNDYLIEVDIPILFLGISEDEQHPVEDAKELAKRFPKTEFLDLKSEENAYSEKTAELVLDFLKICNLESLPKTSFSFS